MGGRIVNLAAAGKNDGAHVKCEVSLFVIEFDGAGGTKFFTGFTFAFDEIDTVLRIDGILQGHRLGILYIGLYA
jgi:hypothetical protein